MQQFYTMTHTDVSRCRDHAKLEKKAIGYIHSDDKTMSVEVLITDNADEMKHFQRTKQFDDGAVTQFTDVIGETLNQLLRRPRVAGVASDFNIRSTSAASHLGGGLHLPFGFDETRHR